MSYRQDPRDQYYNNQPGGYAGGYSQGQFTRNNQGFKDQYYNNQLGGEYAGGYPARNYQDPRDQYYNNPTRAEYGAYQQEQLTRNYDLQTNDSYVPPNSNPYPAPNSNMKGSGGRAADDDDNASLVSSIYSQPSVVGVTPSRYYQEQSSEAMEPRRRSLLYNEYNDYPPSPFANSTTGLTTGSSQQGPPISDQNEKNYMTDNDLSQNTQPQFDVYKDFNNNYRNDETYDEEESRHDTLTGSDVAHDPSSYAMNMDNIDKNFSSNGKGARQSTSGEHYVVDTKKKRRCTCCSRKKCVIISFIILVLLAAGSYFVWPRTPQVSFSATSQITTDGDATITIRPPVVNMKMNLPFDLDNSDNWLPYKFNSINVNVFDAANIGSFNRPVATGKLNNFKIPGRAKTQISIPISFDYSGSAQNDPVLQDFISACTQPPANENKSTLTLRIDMTMSIMGLDWIKKPAVTIPVQGFQCPFNGIRPSIESAPAGTDPTTTPPATGADPAATTPAAGPTDPAAPPAAGPTDPAGAPAAGTPAADPAGAPGAGAVPAPAPAPAPAAAPAAGTPGAPGAGTVPAAGAPATDPAGTGAGAVPPQADPAGGGGNK